MGVCLPSFSFSFNNDRRGITRREPGSREDWKTVDNSDEFNTIKAELATKWAASVPKKLIEGAGGVLKTRPRCNAATVYQQ
jgi:hypothetical protein